MRSRDLGQNIPALWFNALILDKVELSNTLGNYSYLQWNCPYIFSSKWLYLPNAQVKDPPFLVARVIYTRGLSKAIVAIKTDNYNVDKW